MTRDEYDRRVDELKRRYAYLFAGDHLGHDIPPGWIALVEYLCARIDEALAEAEKPAVSFVQIKEKFGGLRAYLRGAPVRIDIMSAAGVLASGHLRGTPQPDVLARLAPLIRAAEARSFDVCVFCGGPGRLRRDRDWILTLCDAHAPFAYADLERWFEALTASGAPGVSGGGEEAEA